MSARRVDVHRRAQYRLKPNVVLVDDDWVASGVWYDGAILGDDVRRDPPLVTMFHPTDERRSTKVPRQLLEGRPLEVSIAPGTDA